MGTAPIFLPFLFIKGNNLCHFLFAVLHTETPPTQSLLLKKELAATEENSFEFTPERGGK